jgi:hypothetical protein
MLKQNYKTLQKTLTELNADGNEDRGHYGEDESFLNLKESMTEADWIKFLKKEKLLPK